jgi:hypothetical protein
VRANAYRGLGGVFVANPITKLTLTLSGP